MAAGLLAATTLVAYGNSFAGAFVFDDNPVIRNNPSITSLWPPWAPFLPPPGLAVTGRPILNFSFALSHALSGTETWGYHALNLAVHVLAGLTLFGVLRRTFALMGKSGPTGLAAAIALVWLLHPIQTSTVTYISQRSEAMMALFVLLTLYCFIREWFWLSVLSCLCGVLTKEVAATAPIIVLLYDRTFVSGTFREAVMRHRRFYLGLASSWLLLALVENGLSERGIGAGAGTGWAAYGLAECRVILDYLRLAAWPHPLVLDYGPGLDPGSAVLAPWFPIILVLGGASILALWRAPAAGFAACSFFLILAPTSSVVPIVLQPMAENRVYLPLAAVLTLAAAGLDNVLGGRRRTLVLLGGAAVLCAGATVSRNRNYGSEVGIWRDTVAKRPENARAHCNLGTVLLQAGNRTEAIGEFEKCLGISPYYADAHFNLGLALDQGGRRGEAIGHYEEAVRLKPGASKPRNNLGIDLVREGRLDEAIASFSEAARLDPAAADARQNLGMALLQAGRSPEAANAFSEAVRLRPRSAELRNLLGIGLAQAGRLPEAIAAFGEALRIDPRSAQTHVNLGSALANAGRMDDAAAEFTAALGIDPSSEDARTRLAMALKVLGMQ